MTASAAAIPAHPELFLPRISDMKFRDDRALMEFPWFSISKTPRFSKISYDDGTARFEIGCGEEGIATIWDKDILIYTCSLLNDAIERGIQPSRTIAFSSRDFLQATRRGTCGRAYAGLTRALARLRTTSIKTTMKSGKRSMVAGFGWIDSYAAMNSDGLEVDERPTRIQITLSDWVYRAIVEDRRVLSISADYFDLTSGMERRLYELARKHLGTQREWSIGLGRLAEKIGSVTDLKRLKKAVLAVCEQGIIGRYRVRMEGPARKGGLDLAKARIVFSHDARADTIESYPPNYPHFKNLREITDPST